jgi:hypothetical protein
MLCCNANTIRNQMLYANKTALHNPCPSVPTVSAWCKRFGPGHALQGRLLVLNNVRNNENFCHAAYRQYVLWQHGRLRSENRRVIPRCCVTAIWRWYPSPNGVYTGYQPARL